VGKHVGQLVSCFQVQFYVNSCNSENRAVREASCACIAELSRKIDRNVVLPYVETLLRTLEHCFKDQSWQVRDGKFNIVMIVCDLF